MKTDAQNFQLRRVTPLAKLLFWCGIILLVFFLYDLPGVAFKGPYGMHQWRQCDAYSMTLNYAVESPGLMRPRMHFQHGVGGGEAAGEFPLTYYLNAQLWRVTGVQPWTLRWTHFAFLLFGFWCLFRLTLQWLSERASLVVIALTASSGLMAFYGPNYLVNAAGLGLVFSGWWYAYQWSASNLRNFRSLLCMVLSFALALLFRPTLILGLIPLGWVLLASSEWRRWLAALAVPVLIGLGWVGWAKALNAANDSLYFLTTIRPFWESPAPGEVWRAFREDVLPQWYHPYVIGLGGLAVVVTLFATRRMENRSDELLGWSFGGLFLATLVYIALWFDNLNVHDYYLIELQIVVPVLAVWLGQRWRHARRTLPTAVAGGVVLVLVFQCMDAGLRTRMKHRPMGGWLYEQIVPSRERDIWAWFHWDQEQRFGNAPAWTSTLRNLGIARDDVVISVPDPSPNVSLSLMDQKGFTDLYDDAYQGDDRIAYYVGRGAAFLVCNDPKWYEAHKGSLWLTNQMTQLGNFRVFDLLNSDGHLPSQNADTK